LKLQITKLKIVGGFMSHSRVAVVTGSTSGIGLGIARTLAAHHYSVMMSGLGDPGEIEKLRADLAKSSGVKVLYNGADLSQGEACTALIRDAEKRLGRIDVLVNNAGIQHVAPIEDFPENRWDAILAVNLSSSFHTIRAALPGMKTRDWGRLINIASAHGLVASPNKIAYVAAKHGLVGLTKVVALETAKTGITCNAICPGWVLTPLVQQQIEAWSKTQAISLTEAEHELLAEKQPSERFTTIEQIGELVVFLCSEAAANLTGAALPIDGGWTAQ
jgi:3-hydroxybutyrate dehydrogenase